MLAIAATACVGGPRGAVPDGAGPYVADRDVADRDVVDLGASPLIDLVDLIELPAGSHLDGVPVGGLSALAWQPDEDVYHALADDPGDHGPPRIYRLRLSFTGSRSTAKVLSWQPLRDAGGRPYASGVADPEGLALLPNGSLLIVSEGLADKGVDPFLRRFAFDGRELARIPLPPRYLPTPAGDHGVRASLGFESLAIDREGGRAYLATEAALAQDGPAADLETPSYSRLLVLSWPDKQLLAEHAYEVEPVRLVPEPPDGFRVAGLVELLAVGPGRLLALERQFAVGAGFSLRLYAIGLAGATDLRQVDSLADSAATRTVCKELLLDFADLGIEPRNLEGLSWGPPLTDRRRTLIVVEDDNFDDGPAARFLRLAPHDPSAASWLPLARRCW